MTLLKPGTTNTFPAMPKHVAPLDAAAAPDNPLHLLQRWISHVLEIGAIEPMYVTLATASRAGAPSSRTVQLLEAADETVLFTTNFGSRKGIEIGETGRVAVSIYWRETAQSVNFTGTVVVAADDENDRRFAQDSRVVQAARTVSFHGRPLPDEAAQLAEFRALIDSGRPIPRPEHWKWFRVIPDAVTFWEGHPEALNRRLHYGRSGPDAAWARGAIQA
ncbi:MAG: pyridoxamine 5'-phosphate oxidase family protein [Devosia sp.]|nr:pyridoxamine 5'-phosphate oxidase family protein [Devosia sp.]